MKFRGFFGGAGMEGLLFVAGFAAILGFAFYLIILSERKARLKSLAAKYGNEEIAKAIMSGAVWQGMSEEQLRESKGTPEDIGRKVYKSKSVETFKYGKTGRNRYALRVTVENGIVVGWERR